MYILYTLLYNIILYGLLNKFLKAENYHNFSAVRQNRNLSSRIVANFMSPHTRARGSTIRDIARTNTQTTEKNIIGKFVYGDRNHLGNNVGQRK